MNMYEEINRMARELITRHMIVPPSFIAEAARQTGMSRESILGMRVIESPLLDNIPKQFRFPRSKKRRIRKKWAKRTENFRRVSMGFMIDESKIQDPYLAAKFSMVLP